MRLSRQTPIWALPQLERFKLREELFSVQGNCRRGTVLSQVGLKATFDNGTLKWGLAYMYSHGVRQLREFNLSASNYLPGYFTLLW